MDRHQERRAALEKRERWVREQEAALRRDEENLRQFRVAHEEMARIVQETADSEAQLKLEQERFEREKGLALAAAEEQMNKPELSASYYMKLMANTTDYRWWQNGERDVTSAESTESCFMAIRDERGLVVEHYAKKSVIAQ